ncbi:SIR2 family protein, partial [Enterococcus faecium]|nr:SIR2 family protein [Enterococcus faecium]
MSENDIVVSYPENVIEEFAYGRGILFLGSGVSSSAINCEGSRLPGWNKFINESKKLLKSPHTDKIEYIDAMLKHGEMLRALQVIKDYSDSGEYTRKVKQSFLARGYNPSKIHDILRRINSKITITTNFDNIYENYCRSDGALGYVSAEYNDVNKIITNIKSTENLIIKAHGSIENPEKLIFTQNEYFKAHRENALFY